MAVTGDRERDLKIAKMLVAGVPQVQVAEVMGLSEGRITQIKQEDGFQEIYEVCLLEDLKKHSELNDGWDEVEKKALEIILSVLKYNKNPDYALKAAMVANRANRRGVGANGNVPLPTNMGERVVIHLHQNFANRLQQLNVETVVGSAGGPVRTLKDLIKDNDKKQVNLLGPQAVKNLLTNKGSEEADPLADLDMDELVMVGDN